MIYFLLFMFYAVFGWVMEVSCKLVEYKRFINRGFLIGPYCPIYGYGALLITLLLDKYKDDILVLFILSMLVCSILEYVTSYLLEKIFHAKWWDYSKRRFNLNGRISAHTLIPFGILGVLMMRFINPFVLNIINSIDNNLLSIISLVLLIIYLMDTIISVFILGSIRKDNKILDHDNTEEMNEIVRNIIMSHSIFHRRLLHAFPTISHIGDTIKDTKDIIKKKLKDTSISLKERQELIKEETNLRIVELQKKYEIRLNKLRKKYDKKINKIKKKSE